MIKSKNSRSCLWGSFDRQAGFTLMELLLMIGILGILAAGLWVAIDPIEQIKKARDTSTMTTAVEVLKSVQRYYVNHSYLPWLKQTADAYDCGDPVWDSLRPSTPENSYPHTVVTLAPTSSKNYRSAVFDCINATLVTDAELKGTFFSGSQGDIYLQSGSDSRVAVCYAPEAKSNKTDAATKYLLSGDKSSVDLDDTCPKAASGNCLQCFE